MANDLNLGDLKITLETFEDAPVKATFDLPDGSTVARNFPQNGELVMRLGLGLGLNHRVLNAPPALAISGTPVLTATEDEAYAGFTATASGGVEPYAYSLVGDWPAGITVNSSTGEVSGTPTESGSFASLSVRVTDGNSDTADLDSFSLEVEAGVANSPNPPEYRTTVTSSAGGPAYTFNGVDIGAAHADRVVVLCIGSHMSADVPLTSVTIGGVACTIPNQPYNLRMAAIAHLAVPTGTTADIVVTWSTAVPNNCQVSVYRIIPANPVPVDTGEAEGSTTTLTVPNIEVVENGALVWVSAANSGTTESASYNGVDTPSKDYDATVEFCHMGSYSAATTENSTTNDPGDVHSASNSRAIAAASWGPAN